MTDSNTHPTYEEKEIRCPKLGGPVNFEYCKVEQSGLPCSRAINCWSIHFDAEAFFRESLSPEQFAECFLKAAPSKVTTLLELIEKARKLTEEKRDGNNEES
jgi:hypothetical protein